MIYPTTHHVPSYQRWLDAADMRWVYASHRRWLQYLQWRCPAERWVLKSPGHLWALDALLAVYPDARIVQTHRDPLKVIASLASLVALLRGMASDRIDPQRHRCGVDRGAGARPREDDAGARHRRSACRPSVRYAVRRVHRRRDRDGAPHLRALRHGIHGGGREPHASFPGGQPEGQARRAPLHAGPERPRPGSRAAALRGVSRALQHRLRAASEPPPPFAECSQETELAAGPAVLSLPGELAASRPAPRCAWRSRS